MIEQIVDPISPEEIVQNTKLPDSIIMAVNNLLTKKALVGTSGVIGAIHLKK